MEKENYTTGTVLKVSDSSKRLPFIFHYGIVLNEGNGLHVAHNTPGKKNEHGGNIQIDTLKYWKRRRRIIEVTKTKLKTSQITNHIEQHKSKPFNIIFWNCEHFVFSLTKKRNYSPQLMFWVNIIVLFIIIATSIYKKTRLKKRLKL